MAVKVRPFDQTMPLAIDLHGDCPTDGWHLAIESAVEGLPAGDAGWDITDWDAVDEFWVEGTEGTAFYDVIGDAAGFALAAGRADPDEEVVSSTLTITLDNRSGRYTQFAADGTVHHYLPGQRVVLWQEHLGVAYPRFWGVVEVWEENVPPPSEGTPTVDVTAVDRFTQLNTQRDAAEYHLGSEGQRPGERVVSLLALTGFAEPVRVGSGATGSVTLRAPLSSNPVLEELQSTARTDGGLVFIDTDGTFTYLDRSRADGRADQPLQLLFTDACPTPPDAFTMWGADPVTDVGYLINLVRLANIDDIEVTVSDQDSVNVHKAQRLSRDGLLFRTAEEASLLASFILGWRSTSYFTIRELRLLASPTSHVELLPVIFDLRIADKVRVVRTLPNGTEVTFDALVEGFLMTVTPERGIEATYSLSQARGSG